MSQTHADADQTASTAAAHDRSGAANNTSMDGGLSMREQVDLLAQALLREHMHRRGFLHTLHAFDAECPRDARTIASRAAMRGLLNIPVEGRTSRLAAAPSLSAAPGETNTDKDNNSSNSGQSDPLPGKQHTHPPRQTAKSKAGVRIAAPTFMEELCSYRLTKRDYATRARGSSDDDPSDVEMAALEQAASTRRAEIHAAEQAIHQQQQQQQQQEREAAAAAAEKMVHVGSASSPSRPRHRWHTEDRSPTSHPPASSSSSQQHHRHHRTQRSHRSRHGRVDDGHSSPHAHATALHDSDNSPNGRGIESDHADEDEDDDDAEEGLWMPTGAGRLHSQSMQTQRRAGGSAWQPPTAREAAPVTDCHTRYAVPPLAPRVLAEATASTPANDGDGDGDDAATNHMWPQEHSSVRSLAADMNEHHTMHSRSSSRGDARTCGVTGLAGHADGVHARDDGWAGRAREPPRGRRPDGLATALTTTTAAAAAAGAVSEPSVRVPSRHDARAVWQPGGNKGNINNNNNNVYTTSLGTGNLQHDAPPRADSIERADGLVPRYTQGAQSRANNNNSYNNSKQLTKGSNSSMRASLLLSTHEEGVDSTSTNRPLGAVSVGNSLHPRDAPTASILKPSTFAAITSAALSRPLGWALESGRSARGCSNGSSIGTKEEEDANSEGEAAGHSPSSERAPPTPPKFSYDSTAMPRSSALVSRSAMATWSATRPSGAASASESQLVCVGVGSKDRRGSPARLDSWNSTDSSSTHSSAASTHTSWTSQSGNNAGIHSSGGSSGSGAVVRHGFGFHKTPSASETQVSSSSRAHSASEGSSSRAGAVADSERRARRANRKVTLILE